MTAPAPAQEGKRELRAHQIAMQNKHQRCFDILRDAADGGRKCPTNRDLADMIGYATPQKASEVVSLIEAMGLITVKRARRSRIVTICQTGKRTAGEIEVAPAAGWTDDEDAILMDGVSEGQTLASIGLILGKTENACTLRFHRIAAQMGPQAR
ncbi:hypothetical protein WG907_04485 [Sphingobium sp. AN558]|uniref:hypothetical protein n=1 Tax=Sphingobium sp. AN558 TaxID=3133442 RepID=UPI0030C463BD